MSPPAENHPTPAGCGQFALMRLTFTILWYTVDTRTSQLMVMAPRSKADFDGRILSSCGIFTYAKIKIKNVTN